MALGGRWKPSATPAPELPPPAERSSLTASSMKVTLEGQGWQTWRFGDETWQQEAWRLYDIIGELRFVANWIGSACSRVRLYVAEVDKNGRVQQETTDSKIAALAETILGGPAAQAEALRMLGINLTIVGDAYVLARSNGIQDAEDAIWTVVSGTELRRWGRTGNVAWMYGDRAQDREILDPTKDLIIRVWTPHPRRNLWADSPTRGAMPMLWEIERLTRFVFAQIDSRLVSAGLMAIPKEVSFPDENPELSGADQLAERLMRTGAASLKGEGTAAGVVPTFIEMPMEALGKLQLIQFTSELSQQALELRNEAIKRFALAMDIDPSILSGAADANHWGAWQIQEGQIKIHIEPLMSRICDGLNTSYLAPALKVLKKDPAKYTLWYDTAPLTIRPERLKETLELQQKGLVSKAAVLLSGDYKITDAPSDEEEIKMWIRELLHRDPNLFQSPAVRQLAGVTEEMLPANTPLAALNGPGAGGFAGTGVHAGNGGPPPPPAPPTGIEPGPAGTALPQDSTAQNAPGGPATPAGITASASMSMELNIFLVAHAAVLRALERAGKRMLTRGTAGQFSATPVHELHTVLETPAVNVIPNLLQGAWDQMSALAEAVEPGLDIGPLRDAVDLYCTMLLSNRQPHRPELLGAFLRQRGLIHGRT